MALPYLSTLFFLSYLSLLNSAKAGEPICPSSFPCTDLASFTFPFYSSTDKRCGLCKLNCENSNPTVQLGEKGQSYVVKRWLQSDELVVYDQTFQHLLNSKSCDVFSSISFPNYPSLSFTMSNNITLLKCPKVSEFSSITENNFSGYYSYKECNEYNLYYRYPTTLDANLVNPVAGCSVIQLPMPLPDLHPERKNGSDLFKLLSAEFPLQFDVSDDCSMCHDKGGYCQNRKQKFHCGYAGEGMRYFNGIRQKLSTLRKQNFTGL